MLRNALIGAALTAALTGCSGSAFNNSIYFFVFPDFQSFGLECDQQVTENATDAVQCPDDTNSEFTTEQTWDGPDTIVTGEIVKLSYSGEEGYTHALVFQDLGEGGADLELWGFKDGKTWHFEQVTTEDHSTTVDHNSGDYSTTDTQHSESVIAVDGEFSGGEFTGTFSVDTTDDLTVTETDEWTPADIGIFNPRLNQYVVAANLCETGSEPSYYSYSPLDADCTGGDCSIQIVQTCSSGDLALSGYLTSDDGQGLVPGSSNIGTTSAQ